MIWQRLPLQGALRPWLLTVAPLGLKTTCLTPLQPHGAVVNSYEAMLCGKRRILEFYTAKILDWLGKEEELRAHANPVARFVLAQLASMGTKKDMSGRAAAKLDLILLLREPGMTEHDLLRWYRYLDWRLALPKE